MTGSGVLIGLVLMLAFFGAVVGFEIHSRRDRRRKASLEKEKQGAERQPKR